MSTTSDQFSLGADHRFGPWRFLPEDWGRFRGLVGGRAVESSEAAVCELVALGGSQDARDLMSPGWWAADVVAAQRMQLLVESVSDGECHVRRLVKGQSHRHVRYRVGTASKLPAGVRYAFEKEGRRLAAGDRWLCGAFEPDQLARALWSGLVLSSPPMSSPQPHSVVWRVPSRTTAAALHASGRRLGLPVGKLERRFQLWRVSVELEQPAALDTLHRTLLG